MPNCATNNLRISGDRSRLEAFLDGCRIISSDGQAGLSLLSGHLPMPSARLGTSYREWAVDTYGTKWPDQCTESSWDGEVLCLNFDTAWGAPLDGLKSISEKWPDLLFDLTWLSGCCEFLGTAKFAGGAMLFLNRDYEQGVQVSDAPRPASGDEQDGTDFWMEGLKG